MSQFVNYNTVIGNGKSYKVPIYQRDYSWKRNEEVEELWADIQEIENDQKHYMGYLVLMPDKTINECYDIIDGQQRLITLSLLVLAVTKLLKEWADEGIEPTLNRERTREEIRRYLGNVDTAAPSGTEYLPIAPKLTLNKNNNDYYQSYLMQLRKAPVLKGQKSSVKLMQNAFDFFYEKLQGKFGEEKQGAKLTQFLERIIGTGLQFTVIEVENDVDAYKIFETLNSRGVKLSPADLLKNYLFRKIAPNGQISLDEAERRWSNIVNTLGKTDVSTYVRHYWNSRYTLTRQIALFKSIKKQITTPDQAFELLEDLENMSGYYAAFDNPGDEIWTKDERKHLQTIELLGASTCYSLMLAYLAILPKRDFYVLLNEIAVITFRYSIAELNTNEAEIAFSQAANAVYDGSVKTVKEIVDLLKNIYLKDERFELAFAGARINSRKFKQRVKYILIQLENQIAGKDYHYEDGKATIEHILPEKPGEIWSDIFDTEQQEEYIYLLGNYTLLSASDNNAANMDNEAPFEIKVKVYKESSYMLSSEYSNYDTFTPTILKERQMRLARIAKTVWKSRYLH